MLDDNKVIEWRNGHIGDIKGDHQTIKRAVESITQLRTREARKSL